MSHWQTHGAPFLRDGVYYEKRVLVPDGPGDGCRYHSEHRIPANEARRKLGLPLIPEPAPANVAERILSRDLSSLGGSQEDALRKWNRHPEQLASDRQKSAERIAELTSRQTAKPEGVSIPQAVFGRTLTRKELEFRDALRGRRS